MIDEWHSRRPYCRRWARASKMDSCASILLVADGRSWTFYRQKTHVWACLRSNFVLCATVVNQRHCGLCAISNFGFVHENSIHVCIECELRVWIIQCSTVAEHWTLSNEHPSEQHFEPQMNEQIIFGATWWADRYCWNMESRRSATMNKLKFVLSACEPVIGCGTLERVHSQQQNDQRNNEFIFSDETSKLQYNETTWGTFDEIKHTDRHSSTCAASIWLNARHALIHFIKIDNSHVRGHVRQEPRTKSIPGTTKVRRIPINHICDK